MSTLIFIIVGVIVAFLIFTIIKTRHAKDRIIWVIILLTVALFYIGYLMVLSNKNIDYGTMEGIKTAASLYLGWFVNVFDNVKIITTNAIKLDWKGNNSFTNNPIPSLPK
jgi:4-amino-4-deoxy-L-arabinose transferase-like glycosyltransferase